MTETSKLAAQIERCLADADRMGLDLVAIRLDEALTLLSTAGDADAAMHSPEVFQPLG